jgi:hypothetical protein
VGLMDRLLRRSSPMPSLVGCWQLVQPADNLGEPAEADFRADGQLVYSVLSGDRWHIMRLVYAVDGDMIVTDQPSSPRKERTRFALEADGTLMLDLGGQRSWYKRGPKVAPMA